MISLPHTTDAAHTTPLCHHALAHNSLLATHDQDHNDDDDDGEADAQPNAQPDSKRVLRVREIV